MRTLMAVGIVMLLALLACALPTADRICFDNNCFTVEVVSSPEDRARGLMFRESLPADQGMLFLFEEEKVYPFWMKNTLIPLDIIWLDAEKEVVFISEETPPCEADPCPVYNPGAAALYVLEINAGQAAAQGIEVGERAMFDLASAG